MNAIVPLDAGDSVKCVGLGRLGRSVRTVSSFTCPFIKQEFMGITLASYSAAHPEEVVNGTIRVCVGGGAGFIGSHIAKKLKEAVGSTLKYK